MAQVVDKAKKKLSLILFIGITPGGIALLSIYTTILIPTVPVTVIIKALALASPFIIGLILVHEHVLMKRRWDKASKFIDQGEESGVTGSEALASMLDFPIKMPLFGLFIWCFCGFLVVVFATGLTDWKLRPMDFISMLVSIWSAAAIITIFQFYYWRDILDPVVGMIIHKSPDILNEKIDSKRLALKSFMSITLIPLIGFSFFIAALAGYRQASTAVQQEAGSHKLKWLKKEWNAGLSSSVGSESRLVSSLKELKSEEGESFNVYLVRKDEDKDGNISYRELVRDMDYMDHMPEVGVDIMTRAFENKEGAVEFDLFHAEIMAGFEIEVGGRPGYYLMVGFPWGDYNDSLGSFAVVSLLLLAVVVLISVLVVRVIAGEVSRPIKALVGFAKEVGKGNIHSDVFYHANDEVGDLSLALRRMSLQLGGVLGRITDAICSLEEATGAIRGSALSVEEGARMQDQAIDDVSSATTQMDMSIQGIAENVEALSASAEESSSSIFEMGAAVKKINESVDILNQSISEVSSSINEMTVALDQVAGNVTNLSAVTEETASSMSEMDASIREVEKSAKDTANWSESVLADAEAGVEAVGKVTGGMHEISEVVLAGQQVIERLGDRVAEIGKIVKVIDDVANQTNLLALNAAIIAAQAGEHGRGFAVVADEIKELAERTSGSTREIHQLIKGVQEESVQAVGAIEEGARAVESGVQLTDQASSSLAQIMESTRQAAARVQGIANTTIEQAESSRQVSKAIDKVADMVNQISVATSEQTRGGALILRATEEMKTASLQVKRNAEEQLQGSKLITKSIENITQMLYSISQAQQEEKKSSSQIIQLMERIKMVSQESTDSAARLSEVVDILTEEAANLRKEMGNVTRENGPNSNGRRGDV